MAEENKPNPNGANQYTSDEREQKCVVCGYSKHLEKCHIIPARFVRITENYQLYTNKNNDNIISLCRNHHWEYDHDLLDIKDFKKIVEHIITQKPTFLKKYSYFVCGKVVSVNPYTNSCNLWILKEREKLDKLGLLVDN